MPLVLLEHDATDGVRVLRLNDPDRRNALSPQLQRELIDAVDAVAHDSEARVLVVTGTGSAFCAGADLRTAFSDVTRPVSVLRDDLRATYESFLRVGRLRIPTIAAVNGTAVGAGVNLAMCCDLRIAGPRARFGVTFTRLGLHPGGGCTHFLVQTLGAQGAFALLLDGGTLDASEALAAGLVLQVDDDPLQTALETAARYAALDPDLAADIKHSVAIAAGGALDTVLDFEAWAQASSASKPGFAAAIAEFAGRS